MVYESCYWKDDLRSYTKELSDFSTCTTLEDKHRDYRLEKALLLSAFTVRLLLDANKLSDGFDSCNLKVDFYSAKKDAQKNISPLDKRFIDERYFDLASPTSSSISLRQLTNQLIHSAVVVAFSYDNANRVLGFFVVSDNDYENRLCYCSIKECSVAMRVRFLRMASRISGLRPLDLRRLRVASISNKSLAASFTVMHFPVFGSLCIRA